VLLCQGTAKPPSDALASNAVLAELDLSNNYLKPELAQELAVGIRDNGALSSGPPTSQVVQVTLDVSPETTTAPPGLETAVMSRWRCIHHRCALR
jgi:hypothetical protein